MRNVAKDLSIIIPARAEMFLAKTIENILENIEGNTEIIAVLDGQWADPPLPVDERVTVLFYPKSIGQRAACNRAVSVSDAKYVMKIDAHCSFDKGFDAMMMKDMQPDWTFVPLMKNLHAFDWVCPDGHSRYQGPSGPCEECGKPTERDILWHAKKSPNSTSYRVNSALEFKYFGEYKKKQTGDLVETMSLQGSCFMVTREKYHELNLCDETWGSWGGQGAEVAIKTWLSGGRVMCNKKTWYAHLFRTQGGDFSFPYSNPGREQKKAKNQLRDTFLNNKWDKQIYPLSWLLDKFAPVPDWSDEDLARAAEAGAKFLGTKKVESWGVLYYTDNDLDPEIMEKCQKQIKKTIGSHRIVSVSLKPLDFGDNICLSEKHGYLTIFRQILAGLKELDTDYVFFAEHDCIYHNSHFRFAPKEKDVFYYNTNVVKIRMSDGFGVKVDDCKQLSGLCAHREFLVEYYEKLVEMVENNPDINIRKIGFEPGTHNRIEEFNNYKAEGWKSEYPNIDLRHDKNATASRWTKEEFRNQKFTKGWEARENFNVPGWGSFGHLWKRI